MRLAETVPNGKTVWILINWLHVVYIVLSHDVASGSDIKPCNKIDKPLVVHRLAHNIMTSSTTLCKRWQKSGHFHAKNMILSKYYAM